MLPLTKEEKALLGPEKCRCRCPKPCARHSSHYRGEMLREAREALKPRTKFFVVWVGDGWLDYLRKVDPGEITSIEEHALHLDSYAEAEHLAVKLGWCVLVRFPA